MDIASVREVRERSFAPLAECRTALEETKQWQLNALQVGTDLVKRVRALREYFHVGDKPVRLAKPGPPVRVETKWKMLAGAGLTKTFVFGKDRPKRDDFVVRCVALETYRGKEDVVWTIEGDAVTVFLKTPTAGLTEPIVEFARILDDLRHDLDLASPHDVEEDVFTF